VRRGEVYDARLDPTEGSEQAGSRLVVIVSRVDDRVQSIESSGFRLGRNGNSVWVETPPMESVFSGFGRR
jgi:hypothetical protein